MNRYDLQDRIAVVTGGAQGIGFAVARKFCESGARVRIWDMDVAVARDAAKSLGKAADSAAVDVTDPDAVQAAARSTAADFGRIDVLVASAGIAGPNGPVVDYAVADWQQIVDVNLHGVFHCCRAVLPHMVTQGYGRIVNIASIAGKEGNANAAAYSASKTRVRTSRSIASPRRPPAHVFSTRCPKSTSPSCFRRSRATAFSQSMKPRA
jgi:NAD(P)-dependent dehydrogenase (short-subunit alcohol dehydrogenase family)